MPVVSQFLIERLHNLGIKHIFTVTGEFVAPLLKKAINSNIEVISTVDETGAAFAADKYARQKGAGCVVTNYSVGTLKIIGQIACAYAEKSPVIVLSGSYKNANKSQREIFEKITCYSAVLSNPSNIGYQIDAAIEAMKHFKQPVYLELPIDLADKAISYDVYKHGTPDAPKSDPENLEEAIAEAVQWLSGSERPVIIAGIEAARFNLGQKILKFAEKTNIPVVSTMLSKSVVDERNPLCAGVYSGDSSESFVKNLVDGSDCLLMLGVIRGDTSLQNLSGKLDKKNIIACSIDTLHIKNQIS